MGKGPRRPRLGRGLDAILPPARGGSGRPGGAAGSGATDRAFDAPIEEVHPRRDQPRRRFDDALLDELAQSIRELGILEPILVRRRSGGGLEIIAGERRWRAAQRAGLHQVPVFVRELSEKDAFEAALVENLQREDLNPIETARAFQRLVDEHGHTQESVASRVGKDRSTVTNALRLLKLPASVLDLVEDGQLSEGHGRALLPAGKTALRLAREAVRKGWSVRETERRARAQAGGGKAGGAEGSAAGAGGGSSSSSANVRDLERRLGRSLGSPVRVRDERGKGRLEIAFASYDELDRLLEKLL